MIIKKMKNRLLNFFITVFLLTIITSCKEENISTDINLDINGEELPVNIAVSLKDPLTRGLLEDSKTSFMKDEIIHIRAEYTCKNPNELKTRYGVIKYNTRASWVYYNDQYTLTWPSNAVSANFYAYYLNGSTGPLSENTMPAILLSDFKYGEDPLYGYANDVEYGHTVAFDMEHLFTHLTLSQISNGISNEMFFVTADDVNLNNAFRLEYKEEDKSISGVFLQVPSDNYKINGTAGLVFVSSNCEIYEDPEDGEIRSRVSFFLEPKAYGQFDLLYPRTLTETATYLNYTGNLSAQIEEKQLLGNHFYDFSILKSLGVVIEQDPQDTWDDDTVPVEVDVEKFLKAANTGDEYTEKKIINGVEVEIPILESTLEGTRLLRNIDFKNFYYDIFENGNFLPSLALKFDGNFHYIHNLGCPLFYENHGSICNLGIKGVNTEKQLLESNINYTASWGGKCDTSSTGIICRTNYGTVSDIRLSDVNMEIEIKTSRASDDEKARESHSSAILFGINRGSVNNISMAGEMNLKVKNKSEDEIIPNVVIGGIAGQNIGSISDIAPIDDKDFPETPQYRITNECNGITGVYTVGGVVGINTGNLLNIMMSSVSVDGSKSNGVESLMGGITGSMPLSNSGAPIIDACIIRGSVIAGQSCPQINITSSSYIGGVAGLLNLQGSVTGSSVTVGVTGTTIYYDETIYGTGGAFGRIEKTSQGQDGEINSLACYGSNLSGFTIGNFAGITPPGYTWDKFEGKNINVKQYKDVPNIAEQR